MQLFGYKLKNAGIIFSLLILSAYIVFKAYTQGNDINIYLKASHNILEGKNIYLKYYLYSPLFALLLSPLSFLNAHFARIIWALINFFVVLRLFQILNKIIKNNFLLKTSSERYLYFGLFFVSAGFLNHNLILGQITILILWLTAEGLYRIFNNNEITGAALIALGINIKILPVLLLFYLFFKQKYKALFFVVVFTVFSLFLPALIVGYEYNNKLLHNWALTINPAGKKYISEYNNESSSLSAVFPAFCYKFNKPDDSEYHGFKRKICFLSNKTNLFTVNVAKFFLILSVLLLIFRKYKNRKNISLYLYWEFAYLMSVSILVFPHQMGYALLYFVPAEFYMILSGVLLFKCRKKLKFKYKFSIIAAYILMFVSAVSGRDIIGNTAVDFLNFYHFQALSVLCFLVFLLMFSPDKILEFNEKNGCFKPLQHVFHL